MVQRTILIDDDGVTRKSGLVYICSGYLVEAGRVLLVHHNGFGKWVPPGGHIEPGESFAEAAVREVKEETGLLVEALSFQQVEIHPADRNATPEPVPFHVDVEREGFRIPALVQFYFVRRLARQDDAVLQPDLDEVGEVRWFTLAELDDLPTFEQVRSLAGWAIRNYPIASERGA